MGCDGLWSFRSSQKASSYVRDVHRKYKVLTRKRSTGFQESNISSPLATTTSGNSQNNNNDDSNNKQPQPRQKQTSVESRLPKRWGWCSEHFRRETAISEGAYLFDYWPLQILQGNSDLFHTPHGTTPWFPLVWVVKCVVKLGTPKNASYFAVISWNP